MTKDKLLNIFKKYITNSNLNFAVLLDGEWGSGKTYFIENEIIPFIKTIFSVSGNPFLPIYVSLYGAESLEGLSREIYSKMLFFKARKWAPKFFPKLQKTSKYVWDGVKGGAITLIKGLAAKHLGITDWKLIEKDYLPYLENEPVVLIFDDLERSQINIIELMGYINNFVEEYKIKTIIVGNEAEINKRFHQENIIQKYEFVKNTYVPGVDGKEEKKDRYGQINEKTQVVTSEGSFVIDPQTLEERSQAIFSLPTTYNTVKEKLIGYTIRYKPDLVDIFANISKNKLSVSQVNMVYELFEEYGCRNIRTFIFGLELYKEIDEKAFFSNFKNEFLVKDYLLKSIFVITLIVKNPKPKKVEKIFDFSFETQMVNNINSILEQDIRKFVETSFIDFESFQATLNIIDKELSKKKSETVLKPLQRYWLNMEDDEVAKQMMKVLKEIYKIEPNTDTYKEFLKYVIQYHVVFQEYPEPIEEIVQKMLDKIEKYKDVIEESGSPWVSQEGYSKENLKILKDKFALIDEAVYSHNKAIIKNAGRNKNIDVSWIEDLTTKSENNYISREEKKSLISYLNIAEIIKNIRESTAAEIEVFRHDFVKKIYSHVDVRERYSDDYETLVELYQGINTIVEEIINVPGKKIISVQLKYLSTQIRGVIAELEQKTTSS